MGKQSVFFTTAKKGKESFSFVLLFEVIGLVILLRGVAMVIAPLGQL